MKLVIVVALLILTAGCTSTPAPANPSPPVISDPNTAPPTPEPTQEEPSYTVTVTSAPASIAAGDDVEFSWNVAGPEGKTTHTDIWYDSASHPGTLDTTTAPEDSGYTLQIKSGFEIGADIPDIFSGSLTAPASGTIFYRALAIINEKYYWSPQGSIPIIVQAPPTVDVAEFSISASQFAFSPKILQVKKGQTVRITLTSDDTTHGFAISEFGVNQVVSPGAPVTVEFVADQVGSFQTFCSVACGSGHSSMRGTLVVTE